MNFPWFIARRYLLSKKSQHAVNIISLIAGVGVTVGTFGLIVVLSVFNGFEKLVVNLYDSFDPDIVVAPVHGKTFSTQYVSLDKLKQVNGVYAVTPVLEENALLKYRDKQYIAVIKGVGKEYLLTSAVDTMIIEGKMLLQDGEREFAIPGRAIADALGVTVDDVFSPLNIYVPKKGAINQLNPEEAFNRELINVSGIFSIQQEFDAKYVLVPLSLAQRLTTNSNHLSSLEIKVKPNAELESVQHDISAIVGSNFSVKNRIQQHEMLYKIMKSEKWAVFLILTFILIIAAFNIIASLAMLMIDKKKDINILSGMGAEVSTIRKIFLLEGLMISFGGAIIGLVTGLIVCLGQIKYGWIAMDGAFVVDAYPVNIEWTDFVYVFLTVIAIGSVASWYPAKKIVSQYTDVSLLRS